MTLSASRVVQTEATAEYIPREDWLARRSEAALEPERMIVDAHVHMGDRQVFRYMLPELLADIADGHDVRATVFIEWRSMYRRAGPSEMRPVGEIEFINGIAAQAASGQYGPHYACSAIVGNADFTLGDRVEPVLEAMIRAGGGRFCGIRPTTKWHPPTGIAPLPSTLPPGVMRQANFQDAARCLGRLGLSLDIWGYHTQLPDILALARAVPGTTVIVNHCGGPLGIGPYAGQHETMMRDWKAGMAALAREPNVVVKVGGLGTLSAGFTFHKADRPPSSAELADAWRPYIETVIELFGASRCLFESNFPGDKRVCSYTILWNAFKRLAAAGTESEKTALFSGTAMQVYRIGLSDLT